MKFRIIACIVVAAALLSAAPVSGQLPDPPPDYLVLVRRALSKGNGVLIHEKPVCVLTAAHVVEFEQELVQLFTPDGRAFSGKVIKRSRVGPASNPGDRMGLALIEVLPSDSGFGGILRVPSFPYAYRLDETFDAWAVLEVMTPNGRQLVTERAFMRLYSLVTYSVEGRDQSVPPNYVDLLDVMAAIELGTAPIVRPGYSGAAVRDSLGSFVGILQGIQLKVPSLHWRDVKLDAVVFTPLPLIKQFITGTICE